MVRCGAVWMCLALLAGVAVAGEPGPAKAEPCTLRELFSRVQQSYNQIESYRCEVSVFARKGDRTQEMRLDFAFKKPRMLRVRVLSGPRRGSEVVIRADGKIRGRQGGLLRGIRVTLHPDDHRLRDIRGAPIWDAEWGALLRKFEAAIDQGDGRGVVRPGEDHTWIADLRLRGANGSERQLYIVDRATLLLRGAELYEGDVLVSRVTFAKERLNLDLPDGYFNM